MSINVSLHYDCVVCGAPADFVRKEALVEEVSNIGFCKDHARNLPCFLCGRPFSPRNNNFVLVEALYDEGKPVCYDCIKETFQCQVCGEVYLVENKSSDADYDVCQDCFHS